MSTKYVFPSLRDEIVPFLEKLYPSRLDDYRSEDRKSLLPPDFNGISGVNLALQCDISSILPTAYYICSRMSPTEHHSGLSFIQPDTGDTELVEFLSTSFYHNSLWFRGCMSSLLASEIVNYILAGYQFCSTCAVYCVFTVTRNVAVYMHPEHCFFLGQDLDDSHLCTQCREKIRGVHEDVRRSVWQKVIDLVARGE